MWSIRRNDRIVIQTRIYLRGIDIFIEDKCNDIRSKLRYHICYILLASSNATRWKTLTRTRPELYICASVCDKTERKEEKECECECVCVLCMYVCKWMREKKLNYKSLPLLNTVGFLDLIYHLFFVSITPQAHKLCIPNYCAANFITCFTNYVPP